MPEPTPASGKIAVADLSAKAPTPFDIRPAPEARAEMAERLALDGIRKLRLHGEIRPDGRQDWRLDALLGATVVQPCVVTLAPVTTRIDVPVSRRFLARMPEIEADDSGEVEMPEDDDIEPLTPVIDLVAVLEEALALNLPLYPRAAHADLGEAVFAEPGVEPLTDKDTKPFAGLAALRDKLAGDDEDDDNR